MPTRRPQPANPSPNPAMLRTLGEARELVAARIGKGTTLADELRNMSPLTHQTVRQFERDHYDAWNAYNRELLLQLFDQPRYADEYANEPRGFSILGDPTTPDQDRNSLVATLERKIAKLRSLEGRLDIIPVSPSVRGTVQPAAQRAGHPRSERSSGGRPRIFVGSSTESLSIAYAVQTNLERVADVTVWTQGLFQLSRTGIESLESMLVRFDAAIFVFTPDDIRVMRDESQAAVRDNVIFEFGLFMGSVGRDHTFIVMPQNADLSLPTDLWGITPATYATDRSDENWEAALGPACFRIQTQVLKGASEE